MIDVVLLLPSYAVVPRSSNYREAVKLRRTRSVSELLVDVAGARPFGLTPGQAGPLFTVMMPLAH